MHEAFFTRPFPLMIADLGYQKKQLTRRVRCDDRISACSVPLYLANDHRFGLPAAWAWGLIDDAHEYFVILSSWSGKRDCVLLSLLFLNVLLTTHLKAMLVFLART